MEGTRTRSFCTGEWRQHTLFNTVRGFSGGVFLRPHLAGEFTVKVLSISLLTHDAVSRSTLAQRENAVRGSRANTVGSSASYLGRKECCGRLAGAAR